MLEAERMRNLSLQATQRESDYNYEKQMTQLKFRVSQLLRYIATDLPIVQEDSYEMNQNNCGEFGESHVDDGEFEILEKLHEKL